MSWRLVAFVGVNLITRFLAGSGLASILCIVYSVCNAVQVDVAIGIHRYNWISLQPWGNGYNGLPFCNVEYIVDFKRV